MNAAICWNERALRCQSRKLGYETHVRGKRGLFSQTITRRSALAVLQRGQHDTLHYAKHRGVGADAEGKREHGYGRESGMLA